MSLASCAARAARRGLSSAAAAANQIAPAGLRAAPESAHPRSALVHAACRLAISSPFRRLTHSDADAAGRVTLVHFSAQLERF